MHDFKISSDKIKQGNFSKEDNHKLLAPTPPVVTAAIAERSPNGLKINESICDDTAENVWKGRTRSRSCNKKERPPFRFALTESEIEEDFMKMTMNGNRPPPKQKKQPRNLQKQLDIEQSKSYLFELKTAFVLQIYNEAGEKEQSESQMQSLSANGISDPGAGMQNNQYVTPAPLGTGMAKTGMAVASTATLVAAQCIEATEAIGAERDHLASVVSSAVNVSSHDDTTALTAAAATALRGAATLKARALKEVWNIDAVTPLEKGRGGIGICVCNQELLAKGSELLKRTRKDAVLDICRDLLAWPGRHLLDDGKKRKYFALKTNARGIVEIECRNKGEYDIWTQGVSRLLSIIAQRQNRFGN
ncbi:hypothetical protein S83_011503 [Arachis hypogaea]